MYLTFLIIHKKLEQNEYKNINNIILKAFYREILEELQSIRKLHA